MDFGTVTLQPADEAFLEEVRRTLDLHLTDEVRAEERRTGAGISRSLHRALGAKGWLFGSWPAEDGGAGLSSMRVQLLAEELAQRGAPYQVVGANALIAAVVRDFADDAVRADLLRGMASGEIVTCLGYTEPDCGSDAAAARTKAVRDGDEWVVDGQKMFTTGAQVADYSMVLARTDPEAPKRQGLTMFLVPLDADGVEVRTLGTMGGESSNMVFYDNVRVADRLRLGPVGEGWTRVATSALAAEHGMGADGRGLLLRSPYARLLGEVRDLALGWASEERPDGSRPIDDPIVRRRLAEADLACDLASHGNQPYVRISSSELLIDVAADMVDMVGAEGLLESGPGAVACGRIAEIHQFAQGTAIYGGTTDVQRNLIAEHVMGLPRHRRVLKS